MTAAYPAAIPSLTRIPSNDTPGADGSPTDAKVVVDGISDEVEAIATELGTDPSGAAATVAARLDALDVTVAGKEAGGAAAAAVASHEAAPDPHPSYATEVAVAAALAGKADTTPETIRALDDATRVGGAIAGILAALVAASVGVRRWWHRKRDRQEQVVRDIVREALDRLDEVHAEVIAIRESQVRHLEAHAEGRTT